VLLHGGGQTRHAWGGAGTVFAKAGYRSISVDLRGHSDSDWSPDGDYDLQRFADDVIAVARSCDRPPALVGASLGGLASMLALATVAGEAGAKLASCLVLVDVAPRVEDEGRIKIQEFMRSGMRGFDNLEDAADAIAAYNPHRPRPTNLSGLRKNLRERGDGRWYWHWDPRFITGRSGVDGQRGRVNHERMQAAAKTIDIPTLLVRGRMSDIVSDESVRELRELVPHAEVADVAGAGHMVAGDRNDAFNEAVIDFVSREMPTD
jgi:non-heme chloroperoxidase